MGLLPYNMKLQPWITKNINKWSEKQGQGV